MQLAYGTLRLENGRKPGSILGESIKLSFFGSL
jgi:hypothetical protein